MTPVEAWLVDRVATSDLTRLFFTLRDERGLDADDVGRTVFLLADAFMLGECLKFASVLGGFHGRDHVVTVRSPDGDLLHAFFACVAQHPGEPPRGACVDVLGRLPSLREAIEDMRSTFGPVRVGIAPELPPDFLEEGERALIADLAATLPWTRSFSRGIPREDLVGLVSEAGWGRLPDPSP